MPEPKDSSPPNDGGGLPAPAPSDDGFEAFYKAYPRKVGKGQARKAWKAAIKKAAPAVIAEGLQRMLPSLLANEKQYRPHPATWLNGERWLDDPASGPERQEQRESGVQAIFDQIDARRAAEAARKAGVA